MWNYEKTEGEVVLYLSLRSIEKVCACSMGSFPTWLCFSVDSRQIKENQDATEKTISQQESEGLWYKLAMRRQRWEEEKESADEDEEGRE